MEKPEESFSLSWEMKCLMWVIWILVVIFRVWGRIRVRGVEVLHETSEKNRLILVNHPSMLEPVLIPGVGFMPQIFQDPDRYFPWQTPNAAIFEKIVRTCKLNFLKKFPMVLVKTDEVERPNDPAAVRKILRELKRRTFIVFPEGRMSKNSDQPHMHTHSGTVIGTPRLGIGFTIFHAKPAVIPVLVKGAEQVFTWEGSIWRAIKNIFRCRVEITFGKPIDLSYIYMDTVRTREEKYREIGEKVRDAMAKLDMDGARPEEPKTLLELFESAVLHSKSDLFRWKENGKIRSLSSHEFHKKTLECAAVLRSNGIGPGDRVGFIIYNGPEWHILRMAASLIGAVSIPIIPEVSDHDLAIVIQKGDPKIIAVRNVREQKRAERALTQTSKLIPTLVWSMETPPPPSVPIFSGTPRPKPDDLAMIFFTSGTTSDPKGVMHTHRSILANVQACRRIFPIGRDDTILSFLPVSHIFQQSVDTLALAAGATIAYVENPLEIRSGLKDFQPTVLTSVPRMFEKIVAVTPGAVKKQIAAEERKCNGALKRSIFRIKKWMVFAHLEYAMADSKKAPWHAFLVRRKLRQEFFGGRLRFVVTGGAPLQTETVKTVKKLFGIPVYQGWGTTELAGAATCNTDELNIPGSCGRPIPGVFVALTSHPDIPAEMLRDGAGEIIVRGSTITEGYYGDLHATDDAITPDGWLHTGDVGKFDEHGCLWIVDRLKGFEVLRDGLKIWNQSLEDRIRAACPSIEQIVLCADKKPHVTALLWPSLALLEEKVEHPKNSDGTWSKNAQKHIANELKRVPLAPHERVRNFAILPKPLSVEDETLTPTQKPKRRVIYQKYADQIELLYQTSKDP